MIRLFVALATALYALAFAFLAIMAVRWPSVLALATLAENADSADFSGLIDWRQLGLLIGGLYFFVAICFYASSTLVQRKRRGAPAAFMLGACLGFPVLALFDFAPGWWRDPSQFEEIVIGAAAFCLVLIPMLYAVTPKRRSADKSKANRTPAEQTAPAIMAAPAAPTPTNQPKRRPKHRQGPVPAAIARQRESFAYHGRRMRARRAR